MNRVIVLNGDYTFLNTVGWQRAMCLVIKGKTEVLKYADKVIRRVDGSEMRVPLVMRLIKVIRLIYKNRVPFTKKNVFIRDGYTCQYCGSRNELTIDHIVPASKGGKNTFENCVAACKPCNNKKNNRTPSEANMFLKRQPHAPTISEFFRIKMRALGMDKYLKELGVY
jgi:5-methylcytosine-specific restriction endonuclease McrA